MRFHLWQQQAAELAGAAARWGIADPTPHTLSPKETETAALLPALTALLGSLERPLDQPA